MLNQIAFNKILSNIYNSPWFKVARFGDVESLAGDAARLVVDEARVAGAVNEARGAADKARSAILSSPNI